MTQPPYTPPVDFLDLLLDAVCVVDPEGRFVYVSAASEQIFGYRPDEMMGRIIFDFVHPDDIDLTRNSAEHVMATGSIRQVENRYIRKDGSIVHIMWTARWLTGDKLRIGVARDITQRRHNEAVQAALYAISEASHTAANLDDLHGQLHSIVNALGIPAFHDSNSQSESDRNHWQLIATQISEALSRRQLFDRLKYVAQYDPLTGLPNRELLSDRIRTTLARARRQQTSFALLFIDLNGFKRVNDSLGHAAGDQLLQHVAHRLTQSLRESDTAARLGGDEFVILVERISERHRAQDVADKLHNAFDKPFLVDGIELDIVPSIGVAVYPYDGEDEFCLLKHADNAMYTAKGRERCR
ncbi:MAG: diguanylate cyclase [Gammaproteobacteria bacterium]|nr:diguanylate cyclase [Gammaproteobacteria bacterium]